MKNFKKFITEEKKYDQLLNEITLIVDEPLNEKINVKSFLSKVGFSSEKHGGGLISILKNVSKHISKTIILAIKAYAKKDEESKEELRLHLNKRASKQEMLDFILRLDQLTLHAITGPIHMIDALTGWHLAADLHSASKTDVVKVQTALTTLSAVKVAADKRSKLRSAISRLKFLFGLKK